MAKYRFKMRRASYDTTGYYYRSWSYATPMTVIAESQSEAIRKARELSPKFGAYSQRDWMFHIDSIEEVEDAYSQDAEGQ